ncbi:MAG: hypothetical protein DA408_09535 [Bacteroidetes bacterium]|nr:MAG: hypothetical protein DA408_09535 [Bacteroidota bacterium]
MEVAQPSAEDGLQFRWLSPDEFHGKGKYRGWLGRDAPKSSAFELHWGWLIKLLPATCAKYGKAVG